MYIHINALNAGIKKDGASGGVAITTAILSTLKNKINRANKLLNFFIYYKKLTQNKNYNKENASPTTIPKIHPKITSKGV